MPCYHPLRAWYSKYVNPTGKRSLVFASSAAAQPDSPISIPCSQCIGCRLERSRQWAVRCCHESTLYSDNCFITLTYDDAFLPEGKTLVHADFQKFMKSLRDMFDYVGSDGVNPIRYYMCGEYGTLNGRPHYHACLFNFDFSDKTLWKISNSNRLYVSEILSKLWKKGFCTIGDVTFESASYVARYITDKLTISDASPISAQMRWAHKYVDWDTGIVRADEYNQPSRRPGLAKGFFDLYSSDIFPHDYIIVNGVKQRPPKYYDGLLELTRPYEFDQIKDLRYINSTTSQNVVDNNRSDRLYVREQVKLAQFKQLNRNEV